MSSIVYQIDKKTGAKYAFESISYWDKDKKQPRSKRKYLGKVDPETGKIIPSRGKTSQSEDTVQQNEDELFKLREDLKDRDKAIEKLRKEYSGLSERYDELLTTLQKIKAMVETI